MPIQDTTPEFVADDANHPITLDNMKDLIIASEAAGIPGDAILRVNVVMGMQAFSHLGAPIRSARFTS